MYLGRIYWQVEDLQQYMLSIFLDKHKSTVCVQVSKNLLFNTFVTRNLSKEELCDNDGDKSIINKNIYPAMESTCIRPCTQVYFLDWKYVAFTNMPGHLPSLCCLLQKQMGGKWLCVWWERILCAANSFWSQCSFWEGHVKCIAKVITLLILGNFCSWVQHPNVKPWWHYQPLLGSLTLLHCGD